MFIEATSIEMFIKFMMGQYSDSISTSDIFSFIPNNQYKIYTLFSQLMYMICLYEWFSFI